LTTEKTQVQEQEDPSPEKSKNLSDIILEMIDFEIEQAVSFHTASEYSKEWNLEEIYQIVSTIFPVDKKLQEDINGIAADGDKLNKAMARTALIDHLCSLAREKYARMESNIKQMGFHWIEIEKEVLIRSMDTLWIEHLEAMDYMRKGIGLRGYGQRDPLVEYKKEAYRLYNELNGLIQKQVVYSIFKVGDVGQIMEPGLADRAKVYTAPAKEMNARKSSIAALAGEGAPSAGAIQDVIPKKVRNDEGNKVGRNDPCPCGSGKKYKKCCGI
jgi:preprotein translocase subunit SecA